VGGAAVELVNRQPERVPVTWLRHVAQRAVRQLGIGGAGQFAVTLVDAPTMRRLNRRLLGHVGLTDVLSFRYDGEPIAGEILVSPAFARRYADAHGLPFRQELARYVVHGLLHWVGHQDGTPAQQRRMRRLEDALLAECAP
jgi:probable rRNA maturation factor